jgi:simple sugar transport system ATP-binding protein
VLIFDEPTAVLTPQEAEDLFSVMDELTDRGKTIIFITHKLGEAMASADEITVLRDGENVGTVAAADTTRDQLARLMVGREVLLDVEKGPSTPGDVVLEVSDLVVEDNRDVRAVDGVSFAVREGEVFGIAGVDGNGQSELVSAITGMHAVSDGSVQFRGEDFTDHSRRERIDAGLSYIPSDRQGEGLVMRFDLVQNGLLGSQHSEPFARGGRIDWGAATDHAEAIVEEYDVRPPTAETEARSLSGGNQQKFIVGREFSRDPELLVAAHPTRGVDVGSNEFIHERLLELRSAGVAVLLISSKLEEVTGMSDRLGVMHEGEIVGTVDPDRITEEQRGLLMASERPDTELPGVEPTPSATAGEQP